MKQVPTLEEITAQLAAQDAELASIALLAETIPNHVLIDRSALEAFDELAEPPAVVNDHPFVFGIRV